MILEKEWPPIRAWKVTPIKGGWTVNYEEPPLSLVASGSTPQGVLGLVINARLANDMPPDVERIKCWLEQKWYKRDPRRFTRKPLEWKEPVSESGKEEDTCRLETDQWLVGFIAAINAAAAIGEGAVVFSLARGIMAMAKNPGTEASGCGKFVREFMKKHPSAKNQAAVQDWAWEFQSGLNAVLGRPQKPRPVLEAEWRWQEN